MGIPVSDYSAGLAIAMAVCAALYHRNLTGEGQYISTSLLRMGLHLQNRVVMREPVSDSVLRDPRMERIQAARARGESFAEILKVREGKGELASPFTLYYRAYQAKDGAVVLGALTPQNREAIRGALGIEGEVSDTPGFDARDPESIAATLRWKAWMEERMRTRTVAEWVELLGDAGVPIAAVNLPEEMSDDPAVLADGIMLELEHAVTGPQRVVGPTVLMSITPTGSPLPAPSLGQHTAELLGELGLSGDAIARLADDGVVRLF
jgi:crotonobetainyl-CoA:carnitine CoA-transferase CaiB-like acyl-CoA transferase